MQILTDSPAHVFITMFAADLNKAASAAALAGKKHCTFEWFIESPPDYLRDLATSLVALVKEPAEGRFPHDFQTTEGMDLSALAELLHTYDLPAYIAPTAEGDKIAVDLRGLDPLECGHLITDMTATLLDSAGTINAEMRAELDAATERVAALEVELQNKRAVITKLSNDLRNAHDQRESITNELIASRSVK